MHAHEIMTRLVTTVAPDAPITAATALMVSKRLSGLPVVAKDGTLAGIITQGDLLRRCELETDGDHSSWLRRFVRGSGKEAANYVLTHSRRVEDLMTNDVITVHEDAPLQQVVELMQKHRVRRIPVTRDGKLVGLISRLDLVCALHRALTALAPEGSNLQCECKIRDEIDAQPWSGGANVGVVVENDRVTLEGVVFDERCRSALHVVVRNLAGHRKLDDQIVSVDPYSGLAFSSGAAAA